MNEQPLNLRASLHVLRRLWLLLVLAAVLGLCLGGGYALLHPPSYSSSALVVDDSPQPADNAAGSSPGRTTLRIIATSDPVLERAAMATPGLSKEEVRAHIQAENLTYNVLSITGNGATPAEAEVLANAVAKAYVDVLASRRVQSLDVHANLLQEADQATRKTSVPAHVLSAAVLAGLVALMIGAVAALAVGRADRRLRRRDDIAVATGVSVLGSFAVPHVRTTGQWTKLLQQQEPVPVDAWRVRKSLQLLGLDLQSEASGATVLEVLSLTQDRKALAVGPKIAVAVAAAGTPTTLMVAPQQDASATAALRGSCSRLLASCRSSPNLQIHLDDDDVAGPLGTPGLVVVVTVIDGKTPRATSPSPSTTAVLAVSAGALKAEDIMGAAAWALEAGSSVAGVFVAHPDPADETIGRLAPSATPVRLAAVRRAEPRT